MEKTLSGTIEICFEILKTLSLP